jgi:hypothetical protein
MMKCYTMHSNSQDPIKATQKCSVQTLPRELPTSKEERQHARGGIPAANNAHNPVMAHQQACRYPVRQEKVRWPGKSNSIPPKKAVGLGACSPKLA